MNVKIRFVIFILVSLALMNPALLFADEDGAVWKTVERRMETWKDGDKEGQLEICHPDFRRWKAGRLATKDTFLGNWDLTDTRITEIKIEKTELQFFNEKHLSVAHYKVKEELKWIAEDFQEDDFTRTRGQVWTENYLVSDYYVKEGGKWLYIGGVVKQQD